MEFMSSKPGIPKRKFSTEQELEKALKELESQKWGLKKTNDGIKTLYGELEKKNLELEKLTGKGWASTQEAAACSSALSRERTRPRGLGWIPSCWNTTQGEARGRHSSSGRALRMAGFGTRGISTLV